MKSVIPFVRAMGIRLLFFLGNILIMASSHNLAMQHTDFVIRGLTSLGFVINKIHSHPFKGVARPRLRSKLRSNEAFLARRKAFKSKTVCSGNHVPSSHHKPCTKFSRSLSVDHACNSRNFPSHQGITEGSHKAIAPQGSHASYKIRVTLSQKAISVLQWWIDSAHLNNGRGIIPPPVDTMIFCNASKIGWGTHLDSIPIREDGWKKRPVPASVFLELKTAFLAFQVLVPSVKGPHICFGIDNCAATSHINKLGGTRSLTLSNLAIEAECPGRSQVKTFKAFDRMDAQSKHFQGSGSQTWLTRHGPICIESEPLDTGVCVMATRAECGDNWCSQSGMELPSELPISSIQLDSPVPQRDTERSGRMNSHCTRLEKADRGIQFFPQCCHTSLYCYLSPILLQLPGMSKIHTFCTQKSFWLAAWKISGKDCKVKDFLSMCPTSSSRHGEKVLQGNKRVLGDRGVGWCDSLEINCFSASIKNILTYCNWHTFSMRKVCSIAQSMFTGQQSLHSTYP